jgi:pimeloyl-ACP methyl ester carboxylesterase
MLQDMSESTLVLLTTCSDESLDAPSLRMVGLWRVSIIAWMVIVLVGRTDLARAGDVVLSDPYGNGSYLAVPALVPGGPSANMHRAVYYNHGGKGPLEEGGDPQKIVEMLAAEGFIAYAKKRGKTSVVDTLTEVQEGLTELRNLTSEQLQNRSIVEDSAGPGVSVFGYSRGALLSLRLAELREDSSGEAVKIDKVILAAMAPGSGSWIEGGALEASKFTTADQYLSDGSITATNNIELIDSSFTEFFMIAAANDQPIDNPNNNLVDMMTTANQRMTNRSGTAVTSTLKIYDSWRSPATGHNLFMKVADGGQDLVNEPGYYWYDIVRFLKNESIDTTYTALVPEPGSGALAFLGAAGLVFCRRYRSLRAPRWSS